MRGFRSLAILVAVLGGLVAYIYLVDAKKPVEPEGSEKHDKVFAVEGDKVDTLTVKASNGDVTTLKKANNTWQLTAPSSGKADGPKCPASRPTWPPSRSRASLTRSPGTWRRTASRRRASRLPSRRRGTRPSARLKLGSKTPTGGDMYAQRGNDAKVFLVPAYLESSFDRKTFDLRDKSLLASTGTRSTASSSPTTT